MSDESSVTPSPEIRHYLMFRGEESKSVPEAEARQHVSEQWQFVPGTNVSFTDGVNSVTLKGEDPATLELMRDNSFRLVPLEHTANQNLRDNANMLEAIIFGLGRGVSRGGIDVLAGQTRARPRVKAAKEAFPIASELTEAAGIVASTIATGGLFNKASLTTKLLAGGTLGMADAVQNRTTEVALNDKPFVWSEEASEKLSAATVWGAGVGIALGGVGAVSSGLLNAAPAVTGSLVKGFNGIANVVRGGVRKGTKNIIEKIDEVVQKAATHLGSDAAEVALSYVKAVQTNFANTIIGEIIGNLNASLDDPVFYDVGGKKHQQAMDEMNIDPQHQGDVILGSLDTYRRMVGLLPQGHVVNSASGLQPFAGRREFTDEEKHKARGILTAYSAPVAILALAANGMADKDTVNAVKQLYPGIYSQFRVTLLQGIAGSEKPLKSHEAWAIGLNFDVEADILISPAVLQRRLQENEEARQEATQTSTDKAQQAIGGFADLIQNPVDGVEGN